MRIEVTLERRCVALCHGFQNSQLIIPSLLQADPMKPTLDRMVEMIVQSLSGTAKDFYLREFAFFDEVTSISAKLKPFIRNTKIEKKVSQFLLFPSSGFRLLMPSIRVQAKIDEEMAKIQVDKGVYLPSNPDGVVVDIDRNSGRPLQSHAKVRPFHSDQSGACTDCAYHN